MFLYFLLILCWCSSAMCDRSSSKLNETNGSGVNNTSVSNSSQHSNETVVKKNLSKNTEAFLTGSMTTAVIPSIYILVFIISVPLNAAAIFMFTLRIRPKKPAVIYMLNLATADLLFVLLLPFKASYHYNGNNWVFGSAMCRVVTFAFYCNMYCSVLLITSISADRFLAVVYPIRSLTFRSQQKAVAVCCTMWLLGIAGLMPILLLEQTVRVHELGITTCHDVQYVHLLQGFYVYFFPTITSLFFFIPLIITTTCYLCIILSLSCFSKTKRTKKTRAVGMTVTVLAVFVVCFTPSNVLLLASSALFAKKSSDSLYTAYLTSVSFGTMSCCLDPVIYFFGSSQLRKTVARLLSRGTPQESSQLRTSATSDQETFPGSL